MFDFCRNSTYRMSPAPPLFSLRSHRFRICILLMWALFHSVAMKVNLNMAIIATVDVQYFREYWNKTANNETEETSDTKMVEYDGGYNGTLLWVPPMQAILFSATAWGSLPTVVVAGKVIQRTGAKAALGVAIAVSIVVTLITPCLSEFSYPALFAARVAMGAAESFIVPSIGAIAGRWIPPSERFPMMEMITSGNQLAASFSAVVTAVLCLTPMGWQTVYYFYGLIAALWLLAWIFLGANSPSESSIISESEADFIVKTISPKPIPGRTSWRAMFTSRPLCACLLSQFVFVYTATIIQNGLFTLIPFGSMLIMKTVFGVLARRLNESKFSTPTGRAKLFQSICSLGPVCGMIAIGVFASPDMLWVAVVALAIFGCSISANVAGVAVSTQSLSREHSDAITKISATVAVVAGICAPMVMWFIMMLKASGIVESIWKTAFCFASCLNLLAGVVFLIFGEVGDQGWKCKEMVPSRRQIYSIERIENGR